MKVIFYSPLSTRLRTYVEDSHMLFKIRELVVEKGLLRGPFGGALKKEIFVPKGEDTYKVYEQGCVLNHDHAVGNYYISKEYFCKKMKNFEVLPGDILVSCSGVNYGAIYKMPEGIEKGIINQALLRIRLKEDIINPDYFCYLFDNLISEIITTGSGDSTIPNFPPLSIIKEIEIDIPSLPSQKKIADFLNNYKKKINLNNEMISVLTNKIKDMYSFYIKTATICKTSLDKCSTIKTGKRDANYMTKNGQFKFYTCSEEEYRCDTFSFSGKNVLVAGNGSLYVKAVDEEFDAYQRTYVIKPNHDDFFGVLYLACDESLEGLRKQSSGSIVKFIKIKMLQDIEVCILKTNRMQEINDNLIFLLQLKRESEYLRECLIYFSKQLLSNAIILKQN